MCKRIQMKGKRDSSKASLYDLSFEPRISYLSQKRKENRNLDKVFKIYHFLCTSTALYLLVSSSLNDERYKNILKTIYGLLNGLPTTGLISYMLLICWITAQWLLVKKLDKHNCYKFLQAPLALCLFHTLRPLLNQQYGIITRLILGCEMVRFGMKGWSLALTTHGKSSEKKASFQELVFYLFAPTLVFQKTYPRNNTRSWRKIFQLSFLICVHMIFIGKLLINLSNRINFLITEKSNNPLLWTHILMMAPIIIILFWYFHFHLWSNLFAELLRFADRRFYGPWWQSRSIADLVRDWNPMIHIFIKTAIYKPLRRDHVERITALILVALLVGYGHDFVVSFALLDRCLAFTTGYLIGVIIFYLIGEQRKFWPLPQCLLVFEASLAMIYIIYTAKSPNNQNITDKQFENYHRHFPYVYSRIYGLIIALRAGNHRNSLFYW